MTPERWTRIKELVADALERDPDERDSYLDSQCADDEELRSRVLKLLALESGSGGFLEAPPRIVRALGERARVDADRERVGKYVLGDLIASGASGDVYEATQEDPRRRVAVKVMRASVHATRAAKRFEREGQVLARLRHPGIAHVYEAGIDESGSVPIAYMAMELVPEARTLTAFADEWRLDVKGRVALIVELCGAVEHAHARGIVHRDLKPSNVLVSEDGRPRVIDFGVARLLHEDEHGATVHTATGDIIGTLGYMGPEQCGGSETAADARSDVYALGAMLFELLAGALPIDVAGMGIDGAVRAIRLQAPARLRHVDPSLGRDLDAITAKALAKSPADRYADVSALASDLRRYLDDVPVVARPPSAMYAASLFAKRNKGLVAGGAVAAATLIIATGVSTWFGVSANQAAENERRALEEESAQRSIAEGVITETERFFDAPANFSEDSIVDVRDRLDEVAALWDAEPPENTIVEARLRHRMAHTWMQYRRFDKAIPQYERSLALFEQNDPRSMDYALALTHYAITLTEQSKDFERGGELFRRALEIRSEHPGPGRPEMLSILQNVTMCLSMQGNYEEADPLFLRLIRERERANGHDHILTVATIHELARGRMSSGSYESAIEALDDALERARRTSDDSHPIIAGLISKKGISYRELGRLSESRACLGESWEIALAHRTPGTPDWNFLLHEYVKSLQLLGESQMANEALATGIEALEARLEHETDDHKIGYVTNIRDRFVEQRVALESN